MADVIEQAQQFEAINLAQAMKVQQARAAATPRLRPVGRCLNPDCEADDFSNPQRLFCGPACERAFHKITRH